MRVIDFFSGLGGWSAPWSDCGRHDVMTVDIDPRFGADIQRDIRDVSADDLGPCDVVLASPPCTAFSVASIGRHWEPKRVHPARPKTREAVEAVEIVRHTLDLIRGLEPSYWWMENPRGKLRTLPIMQGLQRVTVTYCQYGRDYMKPTDLWGEWGPWTPKPPCRNGDLCHVRAPRGAKTGLQGIRDPAVRALIPRDLADSVHSALCGGI